MRPQFFIVYINYLAENLDSNPKLFAGDTTLFWTPVLGRVLKITFVCPSVGPSVPHFS